MIFEDVKFKSGFDYIEKNNFYNFLTALITLEVIDWKFALKIIKSYVHFQIKLINDP
jgi:hypothetical protein